MTGIGARVASLLRPWIFLLLCTSAAAASTDPWAPFDAPWFDTIGIADGLPHSITTSVVQDRDGLIWVGTMGGLVRYDGYRIQVFGAHGDNAPGLPDVYVRSLLALPDGSLLIGTNAGGLARFDPKDNSFHVFPVGANGLSDSKIYGLADDRAGGVWIATDNGLDHLDLRSGAIRQLDTGPDAAPRNFSVMQDQQGNLWVGNDQGLFERKVGTDVFTRPEASDPAARTVLADKIWAILQDSEGRLWAGGVQAGAAYRDASGQWQGVPGFSGYPGGIRHATVRGFLECAPGAVWIATDGSGLIEYRPGFTTSRRIKHDPAMASSLPGNAVRGLLRDRSGNVWAATDLGLARNNPLAHTAFSVLPSPLNPYALSDTNVHSLFVDSRGRIWLGLGAGHLDVIDLDAGRIHHLQLSGSQTRRDVRSITESADGHIWIGSQGLARIDPDTLAIENRVIPGLRAQPIVSLAADGMRLLIGTYDGLYRLDLQTGALDRAVHEPGKPASLAADTIRQIARVGDRWWFSTTSGISVTDGDGFPHRFINLRHRAGDPASLPQNLVGLISSDAQGRALVATSGGLAVAAPPQRGAPWQFRTIGLAEGLSSDKVSAALPDSHGRIWASLSNGIARIDADTGRVANLGIRDGLRIASYVNLAAARAPGGELLFGGMGGLTVIRPDWIPPQESAAPLAITRVVIEGESLPYARLPRDGGTLKLNHRSHNFRVDFALLDYRAPMETAYSYRMDGLDKGWIEVPAGSPPSAIYTNLPHGDFRLQLRASTRGLRPHTVATTLAIDVEPRWYETIVSRIAAALLLITLVAVLVHLRTLYLNRRAALLQHQVDERTRDLLAANKRLAELASSDGLTGVYNRRRFLELARRKRDKSNGGPICMALFDLDRFKLINDTHGHLAGDAVICEAIEIIKRHCRQNDLVGRYGGEEFIMCLPDTDTEQAREVIERICTTLAAATITYEGHRMSVTASIGVAALRPGESLEHWLYRADKALYEAKHAGRNRCVVAT